MYQTGNSFISTIREVEDFSKAKKNIFYWKGNYAEDAILVK